MAHIKQLEKVVTKRERSFTGHWTRGGSQAGLGLGWGWAGAKSGKIHFPESRKERKLGGGMGRRGQEGAGCLAEGSEKRIGECPALCCQEHL